MLSALPKLADRDFVLGFLLPALLAAAATAWAFPEIAALAPLRSPDVSDKRLSELAYLVVGVWLAAVLLMAANHALYRARIEEQEARSTIGSGDAFLAGYVAARYQEQSPIECLRYGVACVAESVQHFGAGLIDPGAVERLLGEVELEHLEIGAEIG